MTNKTFLILATLFALIFVALVPRWMGRVEPPDSIADGRVVDVGHFVLDKDGERMLDESFTLLFHPEEGYLLISQSQLTASGLTLSIAQQTHYDVDGRPLAYQMAIDGAGTPQVVTASVEDDTLSMEARVGPLRQGEQADADASLALLDNNLIAHYAMLLLHLTEGNLERAFRAAIPQALAVLPATWDGPERLAFRSGSEEGEGDLYTVTIADTELGLVAVDGTLIAVLNRTQGTVGYDIELLPEGFVPAVVEIPTQADGEDAFHEVEFPFASGPLEMAGTLMMPSSGDVRGVVLFLHGSGPIDRDGNATGLGANVQKQLAVALAEVGVASVRYDKRGVGESGGDLSIASRSDLVDDARAALDALRATATVSGCPIFLIGHSEGAYLAPILAAEDSEISGIVLLCGAAQSLADVTRWQVETLLRLDGASDDVVAAALEQEDEYLDFVRASTGQWSDVTDEALREAMPWLSGVAISQLRQSGLGLAWLREHYNDDPAATLARVRCPVLALNGDKDVQVPPSEGRRIEEALRAGGNESVDVVLLADLNHLLREHPEEPSLFIRHLDDPVDARVVQNVSDWIVEHYDG